MKEKGKGTRETEKGNLPPRNKGLSLQREETDAVHTQMAVYKGKEEDPVLILIGHVN